MLKKETIIKQCSYLMIVYRIKFRKNCKSCFKMLFNLGKKWIRYKKDKLSKKTLIIYVANLLTYKIDFINVDQNISNFLCIKN